MTKELTDMVIGSIRIPAHLFDIDECKAGTEKYGAMTEEESALYDLAMKKGQYILCASIVLAVAWREEERERAEREQERKEYFAKLRLERPELFVK